MRASATPATSGHLPRRVAPVGPVIRATGAAVVALFAFGTRSAAAQEVSSTAYARPVDAATADAPAFGARVHERATSLMLGGFAVAQSRLALAKAEHARGLWSVIADVTRDGVRERWTARAPQPASRGAYVLWAASAGVRRYTRAGARGFYAEGGGGVSRASLEVTPEGGVAAVRRATVPLAALGAGGRFGIGRTPAFVELGLRTSVPLQTRHLYTDAAPPAGGRREPVSYHSWYLGRGKPSSQMFVGVGVTR
jgi:hypothetical protein